MVDNGATEIEFPVVTKVPPHEPTYHCAVAPVPAVPPESVNVVDAPEQIAFVPVIDVGAVLFEFTVTACEIHEVVLQVPEYLTKYVVFDVGDTVIEFPVPTEVPPHDPENH